MVVIAVAVLLLTHKSNGNGTTGPDGIVATAGVFSFHIDPPQALATSADSNPDKADKAAKPAASAVEKLIHDFYVKAYLDPAEWTNGAYADAFAGFSDGAKAKAMSQLDAMTAGTTAADTIATIKEKDAHLREKVLMDPNGQPNSVVAVVTFEATVNLKDGTVGTMLSQGQYILEKAGSGWQVTSFSVTRTDHGAKTSAGSGTATPTGSSS